MQWENKSIYCFLHIQLKMTWTINKIQYCNDCPYCLWCASLATACHQHHKQFPLWPNTWGSIVLSGASSTSPLSPKAVPITCSIYGAKALISVWSDWLHVSSHVHSEGRWVGQMSAVLQWQCLAINTHWLSVLNHVSNVEKCFVVFCKTLCVVF